MPNRKIAIIKSQPSFYYGGKEKQFFIITSAWAEYGLELFFYLNCPILEERLEQQYRIKKTWMGYDPVGTFKSFFFLFLFPFLFIYSFFFLIYLRMFKKVKHLYLVNLAEKIILTFPAKFLGMNVIWEEFSINEIFLPFSPWKLIYSLMSNFAQIITYSQSSKNIIMKQGISGKRISVVYPGINLKEFESQESIFHALAEQNSYPKKLFKIGTLCHLSKKNGLEYMLQALKIIVEIIPEAQLVIIGTGEERFNLNWLVRKLNLGKHIWFMGYQENYGHWLSSLDLFALPAIKSDSLNLAIIEAMAHFCPIIASNIPVFEEIVKHNLSGILVEPGNPEMIAQAVIHLYREERLRKEMGENAYHRAKSIFNIERVMNDFEKIL